MMLMGLKARGVRVERRHLDAHRLRPGGTNETRIPGERQIHVRRLVQVAEAAEGQLVGEYEGIRSGGRGEKLVRAQAQAAGRQRSLIRDLVDHQAYTTALGARDDEDLQNLRLPAPRALQRKRGHQPHGLGLALEELGLGPAALHSLPAFCHYRDQAFEFLLQNPLRAGHAPVVHQPGLGLRVRIQPDAQGEQQPDREQAQQQDRDQQLHQGHAGGGAAPHRGASRSSGRSVRRR